jgi:AcrR family transcriptional regulator
MERDPEHAMTTAAMPRKSDETRARILAAAREHFARDGYERTTIRGVAHDAGIDPAMVMRYFGSKEGLFLAATPADLGIPDLRSAPRSKAGEAMVEQFFQRWEGGDESLQILLRTAASNEDAAERGREVYRKQILAAVVRLRGKAGSERAASLLATQLLGLAYCLYILRLPALRSMSRKAIVESVGATIQRYLE